MPKFLTRIVVLALAFCLAVDPVKAFAWEEGVPATGMCRRSLPTGIWAQEALAAEPVASPVNEILNSAIETKLIRSTRKPNPLAALEESNRIEVLLAEAGKRSATKYGALAPQEMQAQAQELHVDLNRILAILGGPKNVILEEDFWSTAKVILLARFLKFKRKNILLGDLWNGVRDRIISDIAREFGLGPRALYKVWNYYHIVPREKRDTQDIRDILIEKLPKQMNDLESQVKISFGVALKGREENYPSVVVIPAPSELEVEEESNGRRAAIGEALETLRPREEKVITETFGLVDGVEHSKEEIAQRYAVTSAWIGQNLNNTLWKLRRGTAVASLVEYVSWRVPEASRDLLARALSLRAKTIAEMHAKVELLGHRLEIIALLEAIGGKPSLRHKTWNCWLTGEEDIVDAYLKKGPRIQADIQEEHILRKLTAYIELRRWVAEGPAVLEGAPFVYEDSPMRNLLGAQLYDKLEGAGVRTFGDLLALTNDELLKISYFSVGRVQQIDDFLENFGLHRYEESFPSVPKSGPNSPAGPLFGFDAKLVIRITDFLSQSPLGYTDRVLTELLGLGPTQEAMIRLILKTLAGSGKIRVLGEGRQSNRRLYYGKYLQPKNAEAFLDYLCEMEVSEENIFRVMAGQPPMSYALLRFRLGDWRSTDFSNLASKLRTLAFHDKIRTVEEHGVLKYFKSPSVAAPGRIEPAAPAEVPATSDPTRRDS